MLNTDELVVLSGNVGHPTTASVEHATGEMPFGQVILGPPGLLCVKIAEQGDYDAIGSGKTTYCNGMQQFLQASGRDVAVVNMDPANEQLPFIADVDISELICLENVVEELNLGPNGGSEV